MSFCVLLNEVRILTGRSFPLCLPLPLLLLPGACCIHQDPPEIWHENGAVAVKQLPEMSLARGQTLAVLSAELNNALKIAFTHSRTVNLHHQRHSWQGAPLVSSVRGQSVEPPSLYLRRGGAARHLEPTGMPLPVCEAEARSVVQLVECCAGQMFEVQPRNAQSRRQSKQTGSVPEDPRF